MSERKLENNGFSILFLSILILIFCSSSISAQSLEQTRSWIEKAFKQKENAKPLLNYGIELDPSPLLSDLPQDWTNKEAVERLVEGASEFKLPLHRHACLKILAERYPETGLRYFIKLSNSEYVPVDTRALAIHLSALYRRKSLETHFLRLASARELRIRTAAIDALGFLQMPPYEMRRCLAIKCECPINLDAISTYVQNNYQLPRGKTEPLIPTPFLGCDFGSEFKPIKLTNAARELLVRRLKVKPRVERDAAARAFITAPPEKYQLRFAEWGVWIENEGDLELVQSVIDEIPPFVHRTQNPLKEFKKQIQKIMLITKPIIHLTSDQIMAVEVEVGLTKGQPWFAYPRPDDFHLIVGGTINDRGLPDSAFDAILKKYPSQAVLEQRHYGYPWIQPKFRRFGDIGGGLGSRNNLLGVGLLWQSVIVSPRKLDWMTTPLVNSKDYQWWKNLRKVESSWVSANDESERFLYYDGPTILCSPSKLVQKETEKGKRMVISFARNNHGDGGFSDPIQAMFVHVSEDRELYAKKIVLDKKSNSIEIDLNTNLSGKTVRATFKQMLQNHGGLLSGEADGLIDSWSKQFFETPGKRVLVRFNRREYDRICPLRVRPTPTECARVGIVLHELPRNSK